MKKSTVLAAAVFLTASVMGQSTNSIETNQRSPVINRIDTTPKNSPLIRDTSVNRTNKWPDTSVNRNWQDTTVPNKKWPDTSMNKNWQDTSMNRNTTDSANARWNNQDTSLNVNRNNQWRDTSDKPRTWQKSTDSGYTKGGKDSMRHQGMKDKSKSYGDSSYAGKKMGADRVIMMEDHIMVVRNGDSTVLEDSITLESGAVVTKDGNVRYSNGKTAKLKKGQYINLGSDAGASDKKKSKAKKSAKTSKSSTTTVKKKTNA